MNTCACGSAILRHALVATLIGASWAVTASAAVHVWEKHEFTFASAVSFANSYADVMIWVDLTGPFVAHLRVTLVNRLLF